VTNEQKLPSLPSWTEVLLAEHLLTTVIVYIHAAITVVHQLMCVTPKVKYNILYVLYHKPTN